MRAEFWAYINKDSEISDIIELGIFRPCWSRNMEGG